MSRLVFAAAVILASAGCPGARTPVLSPAVKALANVGDLSADYKKFLDVGRTPTHAIDHVLSIGGWRVVDFDEPVASVSAGDRLAFVDRDRSLLLVIVGREALDDVGFRLIGAHIDTPAPRLQLGGLSRRSQLSIKMRRYGGTKSFHWENRPLAVVGMVATDAGEKRVSIGLDDGFSFWATLDGRGDLTLTTGSTPTGQSDGFEQFTSELARRYGVTAADLETAELYAVPVERARDVGFDRAFIGAHGQDDRSNSYVAWRALLDVDKVPKRTAMSWLVDREEIGSTGSTGAQSEFLELVVAYLLRSKHRRVTEAIMHRAFATSEILSSDTPACVNPNWPEAHEMLNAPKAGKGPAIFPYTGRGGKQGGGAAAAQMIASVRATFDRAGAPLQHGLLGHVDRGGGGTIAKYLAHRGSEVVDLGVCVISMHSPLELVARDDLWSLYVGLKQWFGETDVVIIK